MQTSRLLALLCLSAGLGACALLPQHRPVAQIRPVSTPIDPTDRADDGSYLAAVRAIDARDYAAALDQLESARQHDANDIRVLNALGVVYDKLGRFDLSARYYAQAAALDPASEIVKHNLAYSALLQGKSAREAAPALAAGPAPPALAATSPPPAAGGRVVQIASGVVRLEAPFRPPPVITLPAGLTGHPLELVDATGGRNAEPLRLQLARLGWTAPRSAQRTSRVQPKSEIVYSASARPVALALARTLPQRVQMVACADACQGVRLVLGSDSLAWKHPTRRDSTRRV